MNGEGADGGERPVRSREPGHDRVSDEATL